MNVTEQLSVPNLGGHLAQVEQSLRDHVATKDPFLSEVAAHLVSAGGKRLRPALVIAAAAAIGAEIDRRVVLGATSVELVHLGSLYHDDVIDDAASRRGVQSVNARWGNLVAILAGDFLLAKASEIAASLGPEVAGLLARTIGQLCGGEVTQLEFAFNPERTVDDYLRSIGGKTASLMATSTRIGALVTDADEAKTEALTEFGWSFGMAFQIFDDVNDLTSNEAELGKPAGHDMVEGTYTLPVILALADPRVAPELRPLLGGELDAPERDKARDIILNSGAIERSVEKGRHFAAEADRALASVDAGIPSLLGLGDRLFDSL